MELLFILTVVFSLYLINCNTSAFKVISRKYKERNEGCSDVIIRSHSGIISSPNYPESYSNHVSCSWHIQGNIGNTITISFDDLDIEESGICEEPPCCSYNWIKIGPLPNATQKQLCGHQIPNKITISDFQKVWIKFHISSSATGGRGFRLYFEIGSKEEYECGSSDTRCANDQCIPGNVRCNGIQECSDGSDELLCSEACVSKQSCRSVLLCYDAEKHCDGIVDCPDFSDEIDCNSCAPNLTQCGPRSTHCYHPVTQRCNRVLDCPNGEDEKDCLPLCPGKIMCASGEGCYSIKDRCNGIAQCGDASDEKRCGSDLCNYERGGFLCANGHCIREVWKCDRTNDCGDGSDENNCLRNSVLTAAVMGSLICALLLVVAISCTCRLHALRTLENNLLQRETPLSRLSREFFFREPPPSYAVATGQHQQNLCVENLHYVAPPRRSQRRSHTPRRHRERPSAQSVLNDLVGHNCILVNPDGSMSVAPTDGIVAVPTRHVSQNAVTLVAPCVSTSSLRPATQSRSSCRKEECNCAKTEDVINREESKDKSSSSEDESQSYRDESSSSENQTLEHDANDHITRASNVQGSTTYCCDSDTQPLLT